MARNTSETTVLIGGGDWLQTVAEMLTSSISGSVTVTNELHLGNEDESATGHAAGVTIELTSMYDGTVTDTLRDNIGDDSHIAFITPENFEMYPVQIPNLPQTASVVAPITSEFSMGQSGRGKYSNSAPAAFALASGDTTHTIDLTGVEELVVVVTAHSGSTGDFEIGTSSAHADIPQSLGFHTVAIPSAGRTSSARINKASGSASGYLLIGTDQPVAEGAQ